METPWKPWSPLSCAFQSIFRLKYAVEAFLFVVEYSCTIKGMSACIGGWNRNWKWKWYKIFLIAESGKIRFSLFFLTPSPLFGPPTQNVYPLSKESLQFPYNMQQSRHHWWVSSFLSSADCLKKEAYPVRIRNFDAGILKQLSRKASHLPGRWAIW